MISIHGSYLESRVFLIVPHSQFSCFTTSSSSSDSVRRSERIDRSEVAIEQNFKVVIHGNSCHSGTSLLASATIMAESSQSNGLLQLEWESVREQIGRITNKSLKNSEI
jgi:hypothetical protein